MQILINQNSEIMAYAVIGGVEKEGFETMELEDDKVPKLFRELFKPELFIYMNGEINVNESYQEKTEDYSTHIELPTSDDELRHMFSSMQAQIVQGNKIITQLTQQNANLSQQIVQLSQEIEKIKGGSSDETTFS